MGLFGDLLSDLSKALTIKGLQESASKGNRIDQYTLGKCYEDGYGVARDYSEALKWYKESSDNGEARARYKVGYFYKDGISVPQDYKKAYEIFIRITMRVEQLQNELECCYIKEDKHYGGLRKLSIIEMQKLAERGNTWAQYRMGDICESNKKSEEAVKWFQMAAEQEQVIAQYEIGYSFYLGNYQVRQDYYEAVKWFQMAAEKGNSSAQLYLGMCYEKGEGVRQDQSEARKWYAKAKESENAEIREKALLKLKELQ